MTKQSLFIVIEGLDGSGKSTASLALKKSLEARLSRGVMRTYEPKDDAVAGTFIRDILEKRITQFDPFVLALGYATNRLDHNSRFIRPWLAQEGLQIVICDRYYLSSLVYNSSEDFSFDQVMLLNRKALRPDVIFFLNVSAEVCRERMNQRNEPLELFETKLDLYRQKYIEAMEYLRTDRAENIVAIDGNQSVEEVVAAMLQEIEVLLDEC
ncbi:MAG: dTMP kinase [Bacteroidota bacterium]